MHILRTVQKRENRAIHTCHPDKQTLVVHTLYLAGERNYISLQLLPLEAANPNQ